MTINELRIQLDLQSENRIDILEDVARKYNEGYLFVDSLDGHCYLFDKNGNEADIKKIYNISYNTIKPDWNIESAKKDLCNNHPLIINIAYRVFDDRYTAYTGKKGFFARPSASVNDNLMKANLALIAMRKNNGVFVVSQPADTGILGGGRSSAFPLYTFTSSTHSINLSKELLDKVADSLGIQFIASQETDLLGDIGGNIVSGFYNQYDDKTKFNELHLFDYIYAVLNDKDYKQKYKTFLEMDFPRVPYPNNVEDFFNQAKQGEKLRHLHLMEFANPNKYNCIDYTQLELTYRENSIIKRSCILEGEYEIDNSRNNLIENVKKEQVENLTITAKFNSNNTKSFSACRVWINKYQYFVIPEFLWDYQIGTYRPVQEYLKKRKNRIFTPDEQQHWRDVCKIISICKEL